MLNVRVAAQDLSFLKFIRLTKKVGPRSACSSSGNESSSDSETEYYSIFERRFINRVFSVHAEEEALVHIPAVTPLVSVVVPTYNSDKTIGQCLRSIATQTHSRVETLVIDDYSRDRTAQISREFNAKVLLLEGERSEAKNYGARIAKGDFLLFVDSDMVLESRVIEECVDICVQQGLDAVVVPEKFISHGSLGDWRKTEKTLLSSSNGSMEIPRFYKRSAFLKIKGYDERLVCGEDFDLFRRFNPLGYATGRIGSSILHLEGSPSLYGILSKAYYYGKTLPVLIRKSPSSTVERYAGIRLASIENAGASFRSVGSLLGFASMKLLESGAYFLGIFTQLASRFIEKRRGKNIKNSFLSHKFAIMNFMLILLIAIIIFRNLLFTTEWPGGGDVLGFISRAYLYGRDLRWLYMWRPYSFGFVEGINFMDFFLMLSFRIFNDPSWAVKAFMFVFYLIAGVSMYLFAFRHTRSHLASMAASLVYILNQWFFSQLTEAHVDIIYSYSLAPLILLLLDRAFQTGKPRDIIFFAFGLSLFATSFHPECIVIYGVFMMIFALFFVFFPSKSGTVRSRCVRLLKVSLPSALVVFLLSAFFLFPFIMNVRSPYFHPSYEYPLEDSIGCSYKNLTDAFTLRAVESWGYVNIVDVYSGLALPDFPIYTLLFMMFLLAYSVLLVRRDRYTVFFAASMLVSVFIAKGPNPPFGQAFVWGWFNIEHFAIFRAANRWIMMGVFSNAFMTSLLVSYLANYVKKKDYAQINERYFDVKVKVNKTSETRRFSVSVDDYKVPLRKLRRVLFVLSMILLIFIFISGFISCFFFFSQGLQVYTPPKQYLAPYEWLSFQQDDYKVISISKSPSEWDNSPFQSSDFAYSGMKTTLGWGHDIGFDSSFIDDKPVLQDGGWDFQSRQFVDYLRFRLARERLTNNMLKILGPFAYKYVVIPAYTTSTTRDFFLNQTGYTVLNSDLMVLQNDYAMPRLFATNQSMFIVGGLESFDSLCKVEDFDLSRNTLFFVPTNPEGDVFRNGMLSNSQICSFVNTDILDLAMISLNEEKKIIHAGDYGTASINSTAYWVKMPSWRRLGVLAISGDTLTTLGENRISVPFELSSDGSYDIWLRLGLASYRGKLSISVDGEPVKEIRPEAPLWSKLAWINVATQGLMRGKHSITFENDGTGYNDIDAIAVIKPSELESKISETMSYLQSFPGRLAYVQEAESAFLGLSNRGWQWILEPYEGLVIRSDSLGPNVAPLAKANATSTSDFYEAFHANDGDSSTRWASEKHTLPQWLELTWDQPQVLRAVRIFFENAYAIDYVVQTWNGTNWIDQQMVTGNNAVEKLHGFAEPVITDKLRIYVTGFSIHDRVSIWELEAYSIETTSSTAKITIPRKGNYKLAARVATGPSFGTLYFKVNDNLYSIPCNNSINRFEWRELGPFNFDIGEQTMSVGGAGAVELDKFLVYSLRESENDLSLNELFRSSSPEVSINYEIVNPCTYQVHVNANETFTLIFSETHNPFWKAFVNGRQISSTAAYSFVNSFYIDKTGNFTVNICFTGQTYAEIGLAVSLTSFISILVSVLVLSDNFRKRFRKPKS
jgi:glycosyltransferase involved in cell wall biosynthesis